MGQQGIDDQFIKSAIHPPHLAGLAEVASSRATSTRSTSSAATTCSRDYDPETAAVDVELAGLSHGRGEVHLADHQPPADRRRVLEQHRGLHERVSAGHREAALLAGMVSRHQPHEQDIPAFQRKDAAQSQTTQSPLRYAVNASASYVTGSHNMKFGFQRTVGTLQPHGGRQRRSVSDPSERS